MNALAKAGKPLLSWCCGSGICGSRFIDWDKDEVNHQPVGIRDTIYVAVRDGCGFVDAGSVERVCVARSSRAPFCPRCHPEHHRRVRGAHRAGVRCCQIRCCNGTNAVTVGWIACRTNEYCSRRRTGVETGALRSPNHTFILPKSFLRIAGRSVFSHAPVCLLPIPLPV